MGNRIRAFIRRNPARVAAWVSATVAIVMTAVGSELPADAVTIFVLSSLGLGEYAQRVEDRKTAEALETMPGDLE